jgi:hypothetical protein
MSKIKLKPFDPDREVATVENALVDEVKKLGGKAKKYKTPGRRSAPDRICLWPNAYAAFAECKATGKKPTPGQLREHDALRKLGFDVYVVDSKDKAKLVARKMYYNAHNRT